MVKQRSVVVCIILSLVTLGIYSLFWLCSLNEDTKQLSGENGPSGIAVILLSLITCGIYGIYFMYVLGKRVDTISNGSSNAILYLILSIFGFGIINYCLCQAEINKHA